MLFDGLSIERVVTLLTPFFAAGAAMLTGWLGSHVGVHLDAGAVASVEVAAFLGTVGIVAKWLHGRQIPAIAQLGISPSEIDQLHQEIETYLAQHAPQTAIDEQAIVEAVVARLAQGISHGPPGSPAPAQGGSPASA